MKLLIVIHHRFELWRAPAWFGQRLAGAFPQVQVVQRDSYEGVEEHLRDAEVIFTISLRADQLAITHRLQWIHAPTAAIHQFLFPEFVNSDILLTNSTEVHGPVVAEHVMALVLALAKKIPQAVRMQEQHVWGKGAMWSDGPRPREIAGATLGLIGVGSIGRRVAKMASAMGMRVVAIREHLEQGPPEGVETVFALPDLPKLLALADFVVMAAPLVPATQGLMNAQRFALMKSDAFLINVGRGLQVEEAALADALRTRRIAGAALDVFEHEPLPLDSPLWDLDQLLITPHTAGLTERLWDRHYDLFSDNLRRYLAHQPLRSLVDKHKGY